MIYTRWTNTKCRDCGKAMRVPAGMWGEPTTRDCGCEPSANYQVEVMRASDEREPNVPEAAPRAA